jgi:hypothetical protein
MNLHIRRKPPLNAGWTASKSVSVKRHFKSVSLYQKDIASEKDYTGKLSMATSLYRSGYTPSA